MARGHRLVVSMLIIAISFLVILIASPKSGFLCLISSLLSIFLIYSIAIALQILQSLKTANPHASDSLKSDIARAKTFLKEKKVIE